MTERGARVAKRSLDYRKAESEGLPVGAWNARRQPWGMKLRAFRETAMWQCRSPGGDVFHTDGHLMLRGPNPDWDENGNRPLLIEAGTILDEGQWHTIPVEPVRYQFWTTTAHIVFDRPNVAIRAEYWDIAREVQGTDLKWEALHPPRGDKTKTPPLVRIRAADGTAGGYVAPVILPVAET